MTLVDRYLLKTYARLLGLSLGVFCVLYLLVDFVAKVDDFIEHKASLTLFGPYFLGILPSVLAELLPLAVLLATFLCLAGLRRTGELTALQAGGIGLFRIGTPLMSLILALSLGVLVSGEYLTPGMSRMADRTLQVRVKKKSADTLKREDLWLRQGDTFVHVLLAVPEENILQGVSYLTVDDRFRLTSRVDAPRAVFRGNSWVPEEPRLMSYHLGNPGLGVSSSLEGLAFRLDLPPVDFLLSREEPEALSLSELSRLAGRLRREGADPRRVQTDFHSRLAAPFASVVMGFLAVPFGLRGGIKGGGIGKAVALTVLFGLAYHLAKGLLMAFGYSGLLPPPVAAWAPNLLFLGIALWLLLGDKN